MNWDAIGAIAETLGAIGVIASLVYLATQIRHSRDQMSQNTQALRAGSYQQLHEHIHDSVTNAPKADLEMVRLGLQSFKSLSEADAFRFSFWVTGFVLNIEAAHYQYRMNMLDEDRWRLHLSSLRGFLGMPGFSECWRATLSGGQSMDMSPDFVALVEEILGEEPDRGE
jgi:hypothetical protein